MVLVRQNELHKPSSSCSTSSQQQQGRQAAELDWIWSFCCSHSDNQSPREGVHLPISVLQNTHTAVVRAELPFITSYNFSWLPAGFCWNLKIRLKLPMWALLLHVVLFPDLSLNISWVLHCLTRLALQIYPLFHVNNFERKSMRQRELIGSTRDKLTKTLPPCLPVLLMRKREGLGEKKRYFKGLFYFSLSCSESVNNKFSFSPHLLQKMPHQVLLNIDTEVWDQGWNSVRWSDPSPFVFGKAAFQLSLSRQFAQH